MPIIIQSKGLQHFRDLKREAVNFFDLTGGRLHSWNECVRMAMADHVKLLQEQEAMFERIGKRPSTAVEGEDPPSDYGG